VLLSGLSLATASYNFETSSWVWSAGVSSSSALAPFLHSWGPSASERDWLFRKYPETCINRNLPSAVSFRLYLTWTPDSANWFCLSYQVRTPTTPRSSMPFLLAAPNLLPSTRISPIVIVFYKSLDEGAQHRANNDHMSRVILKRQPVASAATRYSPKDLGFSCISVYIC
jgi:hypothetical protein